MKKFIIIAAFCLSAMTAGAQSVHTLSGRVVDEQGQGIEYVTIGIPKDTVYTVSDDNGYFTLNIPEGKTEDLKFFHVSYLSRSIAPEVYYSAGDDFKLSLEYNALAEAVVVPGKGKAVTILGKGLRWAGASFSLGGILSDGEWGCLVDIKRPTRVDRAELEAKLNGIEKAVVSFVIYKLENGDKTFTPVQHKPVYQSLTVEEGWKDLIFEEPEILILDPGRYYFAIRFVEICGKGDFECKGYFKTTYFREEAMKLPLSLGLTVAGVEYR